MDIKLAKSAGFCYGVKRAVDMAQKAVSEHDKSVMLGPIIHNDHVIRSLEQGGMSCVHALEDVPSGATVVLRSHGEGPNVYKKLGEAGCNLIDAACPKVTKIHQIVTTAGEQGRIPVIIGTPNHPEVIAIAGWHENSMIFESVETFSSWIDSDEKHRNLPLTLVSQTTSTQRIWGECTKKAKKECTNLEIFDTICNATQIRQSEAQDMASHCDAMIIIGDRKSSNTKRLGELCHEICPKVFMIEGASELDLNQFSGLTTVGITAGASTPEWIIKEVYHKMSEEIMEIEESFAELLEKSIKTLNTGDKVTGIVTGLSMTEIYVDLGTKHAGYIPVSELTDDPTVKVEDLVTVGAEIETYVMRVNDVEGIVTLSKKRLDTVKSWDDVAKAHEDGTVVEGIITEENKGGVVASVKGVRVFIPASQTGLPREAAMSELMKKKVRMKITEVNRARRRVVGSVRAVEQAERAVKSAAVWVDMAEGKKFNGTVKSLTSYGAFVDIGGVDGMVHISELSWSRVSHPSEIVKIGDEVEVYIISFDAEKKKISLGMKDRSQNPWEMFTAKYSAGSVATAKIVKLMAFGAFAEVMPGVDGLIHISQIADTRIDKPSDVLAEGESVEVKITEIDMDNKKISLSMRALLETAEPEAEEAADAE